MLSNPGLSDKQSSTTWLQHTTTDVTFIHNSSSFQFEITPPSGLTKDNVCAIWITGCPTNATTIRCSSADMNSISGVGSLVWNKLPNSDQEVAAHSYVWHYQDTWYIAPLHYRAGTSVYWVGNSIKIYVTAGSKAYINSGVWSYSAILYYHD